MSREDRDKWDRRYRERGRFSDEPDPFIAAADRHLPRRGRALDVAGGSGRHALWLARRGLDVTLVDVSGAGLELAREDAAAAGLALELRAVDLEEEPFPPGPWDAIVDFHFLSRPLFAAFRRELAPGGVLVFCQQTKTNLERHEKPPARFLLEDGELPSLAQGLEIVSYEEGWNETGRHEARLVARRPVRPAD